MPYLWARYSFRIHLLKITLGVCLFNNEIREIICQMHVGVDIQLEEMGNSSDVCGWWECPRWVKSLLWFWNVLQILKCLVRDINGLVFLINWRSRLNLVVFCTSVSRLMNFNFFEKKMVKLVSVIWPVSLYYLFHSFANQFCWK